MNKANQNQQQAEGHPPPRSSKGNNRNNQKKFKEEGEQERPQKQVEYVRKNQEKKEKDESTLDVLEKEVKIVKADEEVAKHEPKTEKEDKKEDKKPANTNTDKYCKLFKQGKCFYGDKCKFLHGKVKVALNKLCKLFLDQGKCKFESKCHFVHMSKEEWESKYRHSKSTLKKEDDDGSLDSANSSDDEFEFKSKTALKKEKQQRLAEEHKQHKEHASKHQEEDKKKKMKEQEIEQGFKKDQPIKRQKKFSDVPAQNESEVSEIIPASPLPSLPTESTTIVAEKIEVPQVQPKQEEVEEQIKKEAPWFDLKMIEEINLNQADKKKQDKKLKAWVDISKTEEGKKIAEFNNMTIFHNDYMSHVKSLKDIYSRELAQIQRGYLSSFKWMQKNHVCEIKHTPTCKKENLPINFDITEGYLLIRIALDPQGAGKDAQFQVMNPSIPKEISDSLEEVLNNIHSTQKSIFRTLKYMDNHLEKVFKGAHDLIMYQRAEDQKQKEEEEARAQKLLDEENQKKENSQEGEESNEEEGDEDEEEENEDPYFNQNDEETQIDEEDEDEEEDQADGDKAKDPTLDLDLNMHCSVKDLQIRKIAHMRVSNIVVEAQCKSCKYKTELTLCNMLEGSGDQVLVNNLICVSCNRIAAIYANRPFVCGGDLNLAFRLGSFTWNILDIRQVSYEVSCEKCSSSAICNNYVPGTQYNSSCHSCFSELNFIYFGFSIEKKLDENYIKRAKKAPTGGVKSTSLRPKKIGTFKQGEPLPKNGACSHYRHSYRFFRFPCCGKAFACDLCHDQSEKHEQIRAKTMLCGYCSREQSIKQECSSCKKLLIRINSNSGYWEGGKGTRNQGALRKADPKKFAGTNKTVSKSKIKRENMQKK